MQTLPAANDSEDSLSAPRIPSLLELGSPARPLNVEVVAVTSAPRIVVGISGSSAPVYGIRLLEVLKELRVETHAVISESARKTIVLETSYSTKQVMDLASVVYDPRDVAAAISSGSFQTTGMVVAPCSMKTLAAIAFSLTDDLLVRAADVTLKEGRRLVLVPRETPLHLGHLRNMVRAAEIGAVLLPPVPAFYHNPKTIADLINHTVGKILDQLGLGHDLFRRWSGPKGREHPESI